MRKIIFCCILLLCVFFNAVTNPHSYSNEKPLKTIIIDAGHGGHDFGAPGSYSHEKDIALAVSLKLGKLIQDNLPEVNLVYTRTTDIYQHPTVKASIANFNKGDLFISIHCNSVDPIVRREFIGYETETYYKGKGKKRKKYTRKVPKYRTWKEPNPAKGTETYIWGADKNDEKEVTMRENEALYLDSNLAKQVGDFDPKDPEKKILYALKTKQFFTRSANLALTVEDEFKNIGRISREARQRQKGIWVLQATAMPSILVELGYISNKDEEDYLNSEDGQTELATAILKAVKRYKYSLENQLLEATTIPKPLINN